jgi:hypothetical protein
MTHLKQVVNNVTTDTKQKAPLKTVEQVSRTYELKLLTGDGLKIIKCLITAESEELVVLAANRLQTRGAYEAVAQYSAPY